MAGTPWRIRLGLEAERDFAAIVCWTLDAFGPTQSERYQSSLLAALKLLEEGPDPVGAKVREEIGPGLRTLHVARQGRHGRHLVMYRVAGPHLIDVIRILHAAMDLSRHIPSTNPEAEP